MCMCHLHQAARGSLGTQPAPALALSRGKPHVEASPCHWAMEPHPCHSGSRESSSPPCLSFTRVQLGAVPGLGARRGHCLQCFISTSRPSPGQDKRILSHVPEGQTNGTQQSLALLFSNSSSLRNLPKSQSDTKPVQRVTECPELEGSTRTIESNSCPTGQSQESHHAVRRPEVFVGFQDLTGKSCR